MSSASYKQVQEYADHGNHRTGTEVDHTTAEWMADQLSELGLNVSTDSVPFEHCRITSEMTVDGESVQHLVVPYEWEGNSSWANPATRGVDLSHGGHADTLDAVLAEHASGNQPLVLATAHPEGALVAVNRRIRPGSGVPTVLIAGRDLAQVQEGSVTLAINSSLGPGHTTNVIAHTAAAVNHPNPLMLTTPLNGWFQCAGERGTGIAVLLDLVERFSHEPLTIVATGGHELSYFGIQHWLDHHGHNTDWKGLVHIGASIAVEEPGEAPRALCATRVAMTSLPAARTNPMAAALAPARYNLAADVKGWLGEATVLSDLAAPLLSFTGAGLDFHTPHDSPERATSPQGLTVAADAIAEAVQHLLALA